MKRMLLCCAAALLTALLLASPALAGGFDVLSAPAIQSLDVSTMTITWDEPDKPGNEDSPNRNGYDDAEPSNWECLAYYQLRIYYADHELTDDEWSDTSVPRALTLVSGRKLADKGLPAEGKIDPSWLTKGNGYYYFAIVAMTPGGQYLMRDDGAVLCASSEIEGTIRVFRTPYVLEGAEKLAPPSNIRLENGQLRWSYDLKLASKVRFRVDFYDEYEGHRPGTGLYLNGAQRDQDAGEMYIDLTGDYASDFEPGVTYNLAMWTQSRDVTLYADSDEVLIAGFLTVSDERLPAPQHVTVDPETVCVTWDAVDDPALKDYVVTVYYQESDEFIRAAHTLVTTDTTAPFSDSAKELGSGVYYANVYARTNDVTKKANGENTSPSFGAGAEVWEEMPRAEITIADEHLPAVSLDGLSWDVGGYLRWEPVEGASRYDVRILTCKAGETEFSEERTYHVSEPLYQIITPDSITPEAVEVQVLALTGNAARYLDSAWSEPSAPYVFTDAPQLPSLKKTYDRALHILSWEPITGEDAAYVGGYVVELSTAGGARQGWMLTTTETSISIPDFNVFFPDGAPAEKLYYNVRAWSNDLSARNHGANNTTTGLPDGALTPVTPPEPAARVTAEDAKLADGVCTFTARIENGDEQGLVFAAAYDESGRLLALEVLPAAPSVDVTLTGVSADDTVRLMLADRTTAPLAASSKVVLP